MNQSITEKIEIMLDMGEWDAAKKMIAALEAENERLKAVVEVLREAGNTAINDIEKECDRREQYAGPLEIGFVTRIRGITHFLKAALDAGGE